MAAITLLASTTGVVAGIAKLDVVESIEQMTLLAAVDIVAGNHVAVDTNGKFALGLDTATNTALVYGVATSSAKAGRAVTAIRQGTLGGFNLTQAYNAAIFINAAGVLGDAAGTESKVVARVVPIRSQLPGGTPDKALRFNFGGMS